jgi:hypothetical protein
MEFESCIEKNELLEKRLAWTLKYAMKASFATTATTALSFLSNLISVIRALRQFGFFMGLCVIVVWLLITIVYAPLCMIDEKYFSKWQVNCCCGRSKAEEAGSASSASGRHRCLTSWSRLVYRFRRICCCVPIVLSMASIALALIFMKFTAEAPAMFPADHNMEAGQKVFREFTGANDRKVFHKTYFTLPPIEEEICNERDFNQNDLNRCSLFWCGLERSGIGQSPFSAQQCECQQRVVPRANASCISASDPNSFEVLRRYVSMDDTAHNSLEASMHSSWGSRVGMKSLDHMDISDMPPIMLVRWETGTTNRGYVHEVLGKFTRESESGIFPNICGLEEICYCGGIQCEKRTGEIMQWKDVAQTALGSRRLTPAKNDNVTIIQKIRSRAQQKSTQLVKREDSSKSLRRLADYTPNARRRIVPSSKRPKVRVVFGLKVVRSLPWLGEIKGNTWEYLPKFDLSDPWAQRNVYSFCKNFADEATQKSLRLIKTWCWMEDFRNWIRSDKGPRFPVLREDFDSYALEYIRTSVQATRGTRYVWVVDGKIRAFYVSVDINEDERMAPEKAQKIMKEWDAYISDWNDNAIEDVRGAFHVSKLWVSAVRLEQLMTSVFFTLVTLIGLAFIGMLFFTKSLMLSMFVVGMTTLVISYLFSFTINLMRWPLGLLEVVAIIYFIGYAVTYSLHIAHKYASFSGKNKENLCDIDAAAGPNQQVRFQRASHALKAIGGATMGSSITTAGTSLFLVFCQLQLFVKLGVMCLAVTILSIFAALGPLVALMMVVGPVNPGRCNWARFLPRSLDSLVLNLRTRFRND